MSIQLITEQLLEKLEETQRSLGLMATLEATGDYKVNEWAADLFHSCADVILKAHQELGTCTDEVKCRHKMVKNVKDWMPPSKHLSRQQPLHTLLSE